MRADAARPGCHDAQHRLDRTRCPGEDDKRLSSPEQGGPGSVGRAGAPTERDRPRPRSLASLKRRLDRLAMTTRRRPRPRWPPRDHRGRPPCGRRAARAGRAAPRRLNVQRGSRGQARRRLRRTWMRIATATGGACGTGPARPGAGAGRIQPRSGLEHDRALGRSARTSATCSHRTGRVLVVEAGCARARRAAGTGPRAASGGPGAAGPWPPTRRCPARRRWTRGTGRTRRAAPPRPAGAAGADAGRPGGDHQAGHGLDLQLGVGRRAQVLEGSGRR